MKREEGGQVVDLQEVKPSELEAAKDTARVIHNVLFLMDNALVYGRMIDAIPECKAWAEGMLKNLNIRIKQLEPVKGEASEAKKETAN